MNCKNCDYPLWNIRNRTCPECGAAFAPSDYDFVPNSVCFCCPNCEQTYYGVGARGHLEPRNFECLKCRRIIDMDEMVLHPAAGVDDRQTQPDRMPWFERRRRGTVKAWFATINAAMSRPANLIRAVPKDYSTGAAWLFMFLTNLMFAAVGGIIPLIIAVFVVWIIGKSVPGMAPMMNMIFMQTFWQLPIGLVLLAIAPPIWAMLTHWLLFIGDRPAEKLSRTAHCIYFSSPANALSAVPCGDCAQIAGKIWWLVSAILMVKEAQRISGGKASFAVITSAVVVWGGTMVVIFVVTFLYIGVPGGGFANFGASMGANFAAPSIWSELSSYAREHDGAGPRHAVELLEPGAGPSFLTFNIVSDESQVPLGDVSLLQFQQMSPRQQRAAIEKIAADQPTGVIAHRLGDVVFTYHGIDFSNDDRRLWAFIIAPDPAASNLVTQMPAMITRIDGTSYQVAPDKFAAELDAQNLLRQDALLPALPADVLRIEHAAPAVAPSTVDDSSPAPSTQETPSGHEQLNN